MATTTSQGPWRRWARGLAAAGLLLATLLAFAPVAIAQPADTGDGLEAIEREITAVAAAADGADTPPERMKLIQRAERALSQAKDTRAALDIPVAQVQLRIDQLGPDAGKSADPAVRREHRGLVRELDAAQSRARRAALAEVEAQQQVDAIAQAQAQAFGAAVAKRSPSPLRVTLWAAAAKALPRDLARHAAKAGEAPLRDGGGVALRFAGVCLLFVAIGVVVALVLRRLRAPAMALAGRLGAREQRFRIALYAVAWTLSATLLAVLGAIVFAVAVQAWVPTLAGLQPQLMALGVAVAIGVYVRALGRAVFQPGQPGWRLVPVDDASARRGLTAATALAVAMVVVVMAGAFINGDVLGPDSRLAMESLVAVACLVSLGFALHGLGGLRLTGAAMEGSDAPARPAWLSTAVGLGWIVVAGLAVAGAMGYITLATRSAQWAIWGAIVATTTYLLMHLVDGVLKVLAARRAGERQDLGGRAARQAAVLLSAILRLVLMFLAVGALLVPFGAGFTSVFGLVGRLAEGFEVGGVHFSVMAVARALLAFLVVLGLFKLVRGWLANSYLPTTSLVPDARDSIDKILRYLALLLGVLWALTAFGVGMEKVAILASALSVGIGFGLQAITQNFVSGLILLVERPVKIGDWVKVGDAEGDIRRINVRSTEIRTGDHSTMIVPNSELVTKVVQNKTKGSAPGRVQVLLSVPLEAELEDAIAVAERVLAEDADTMERPPPAVFVDKVENGAAVLNCMAQVRSPRDAYAARSRIILALLRAMKAAGVPVVLPPQTFVMLPAEGGQAGHPA